ncbi:MAG: hypothetical protein WCD81_12145 [Candidatus Bathyarchaeia archaeon]
MRLVGEEPRKRMCRVGEKGKKGRETILLDAIVTARRFYSEYFLTILFQDQCSQ